MDAKDKLSIIHKMNLTEKPYYLTWNEANFLEKVLNLKQNDIILDVGCGKGRLSLELSKRGYKLYGLDISPCAIEYARKKSINESQNIIWLCDDLKNLNFVNYFDAIFYLGGQFFSPFEYSESVKDESLFRKLFACLKKGGRFLLQTQTKEYLSSKTGSSRWIKFNNQFILSKLYYTPAESIATLELTIIEKYKFLTSTSNLLFSPFFFSIPYILKKICKPFTKLFRKEHWVQNGNSLELYYSVFNPVSHKNIKKSFIVTPIKMYRITSSVRLYTLQEIVKIIRCIGFTVL
ncbi:MAG: class I SAM-dependent methyltransferase, partial [Planctomycetota bacterium]